jgi:AraC-like DNA-binding protein
LRAYLEHIAASGDSSWVLFNRRLNCIPFEWHYNVEYELTLTLNSRGQRFIGDNIANYDHGDLVLIGPRVPHTWCSTKDSQNGQTHQALVLWFSEAFIKGMIEPHLEFRPVLSLLNKSARAVTFSEDVRHRAQHLIIGMPDQPAAERLLSLLKLLMLLASDNDATSLTSAVSQSEKFKLPTEERISRVIVFLHDHYRDRLSVAQLTKVAALSRSSLHRLFKLQTGTSLNEYIGQLRIGNACSLLLNTQRSISIISQESGYTNLANFNRQFKALKQKTPREFRSAFLK